jgi:hypothetical protein
MRVVTVTRGVVSTRGTTFLKQSFYSEYCIIFSTLYVVVKELLYCRGLLGSFPCGLLFSESFWLHGFPCGLLLFSLERAV